MRPGEKIHESLIGTAEVLYTHEMDDGYIICRDKDCVPDGVAISKVSNDFVYRSDLDRLRLGMDALCEITSPWRVEDHRDPCPPGLGRPPQDQEGGDRHAHVVRDSMIKAGLGLDRL
jgi:hypothetical protein